MKTLIKQCSIAFLVAILLLPFQGFADRDQSKKPPEHRRILAFLEDSKWVQNVSSWLLRNYSKGVLNQKDIEALSSFEKNRVIRESGKGSIGVLLYEFASASGPQTRYFTNGDALTDLIISSPGIHKLVLDYCSLNQIDSSTRNLVKTSSLLDYRYQFSPLIVPLDFSTWQTSLNRHIDALEMRSLVQVFLGSFNADVFPLDDTTVRIHVWNRTSKKSLFGGLSSSFYRPMFLGTTEQHITFDLSLQQMHEIRTGKHVIH